MCDINYLDLPFELRLYIVENNFNLFISMLLVDKVLWKYYQENEEKILNKFNTKLCTRADAFGSTFISKYSMLSNNVFHGPAQRFRSGQLFMTGNYYKNKEHGKFIYSSNNLLVEEINYSNGLKNGHCFKYCRETGDLIEISNYVNGEKHGLNVLYDKNVKIAEMYYVNNKLCGKKYEYYRNGFFKKITNYDLSGREDGKCYFYYANGILNRSTFYIAGEIVKTTFYRKNGSICGKDYSNKSRYFKKLNCIVGQEYNRLNLKYSPTNCDISHTEISYDDNYKIKCMRTHHINDTSYSVSFYKDGKLCKSFTCEDGKPPMINYSIE